MTRKEIAALAMSGYLSNPDLFLDSKEIADQAVKQADLLLECLEGHYGIYDKNKDLLLVRKLAKNKK